MPTRNPISWVPWVFYGVFALIAFVILVCFPAVILLVAMFERMRLRKLIPYDAERVPVGKPTGALEQAVQLGGFTRLGTFSDGDRGIARGVVSVALSPDRRTILWAQHRGGARVKLVSRLADGRCIVSTTVFGVTDLSGLNEEEMYKEAQFGTLFDEHGMRLAAASAAAVPYDPETLLDDVLAHECRRVERMVDAGMARYRSDARDAWSYTPRGAVAVSVGYFRSLSRAVTK